LNCIHTDRGAGDVEMIGRIV